MKKTVLFFMITAFSAASLNAESDFEKWKKKQQKEFKSYMSEQEKAFSDMLKKEWEEFQSHAGFIMDKSPKPEAPPAASLSETSGEETSSAVRDEEPAESELPQLSSDKKSTPAGSGLPQLSADTKAEPVKDIPSSPEPEADKAKSDTPAAGGTAGGTAGGRSAGSDAGLSSAPASAPLPAPERKKGIKYTDISFYGSPLSVPLPENLKIKRNTGKVNNKTISEFFEYYSEQKLDETSSWLKSLKSSYKMNGWSVLKIAEKTSEKLYSTEKDIILMTWFLLLKSDYDVKIAYSSSNVYLLYVPDVKIYASPYITENKKHYYFYNKSSAAQERIKTYTGNLVKNPSVVELRPENPVHFKSETMSRNTSFSYKRKKYPVTLEYSNSLVKYYSEYPQIDISWYFRENISDRAAESYRNSLYPRIQGMNEKDAVQFILTFVQTGFEYKTDGSQFGYEKPMFPDETLHYPYIDCEDRSALFISIVRVLTGLDAVALDYPGHIAAAVNFREEVKGDYFTYKGKKYTVCDPTYINASVGMTMPDYKKVKPVIIETGN